MAKQDFPALLQPGMHRLTLEEVHALTVAPFSQDARRLDLHQKLVSWVGALRACGVGGTLWLDGSFLTEKPGPGDIDCVLWGPRWVNGGEHVDAALQQQVQRLLDKPTAASLFDLDLYVIPAQDVNFNTEAYWRGVLGFGHDRATAKGFAEVDI